MQSPLDAARKRWILALTCLAQFMVILDVSVVNVALPSIRDDLGFSAVDLQWVVNAYTLTFAGFLLLGGRAADLLGPPARLRGRAAAVRGSPRWPAACRPARAMLIVARAVQGLGGAVVAPATLAIITTTFAEGYERNRALGYWGAMGAVGGSTGRPARRRADPAAGLAVDPLHQRAGRAPRRRRRDALHPGEQRAPSRASATSTSPAR